MRPKRLVFGARSSQDLFDEAMYRIFGDIPRCLNQRDDILLGGRNQEEHDETLEKVLRRARDFGATFNREKCQFAVGELEFYGYRFTKDGLKPTEEKVRAVQECKPPTSKEAVRSFLGMVGYLSNFIPRYTDLTAPLRSLTHKDLKFKWGIREKEAFENLKRSITYDKTMAYFNPRRPIMVRVEASFNEGLSAGLFQKTNNGWQPVHYISRTMSDTEKKNSQTEKDALAIKWTKNRFSMYLLGAPRFKIITAHKPLIPMFTKTTGKLPPRIEKWVMEMQDVDYELVYEPGRDEADPMDYLSRHPLPETEADDTEMTIKQIIADEHAVVMKNIRVIKAAHSMRHLGITKTKQMLRARYWFPEMNRMIEKIIGSCFECLITTKQNREEPVKPSEIPRKPWATVAVDLGGPYPDGHYNLVVIDKRTRFPEVETVMSTSFKACVEKLRKVFSTHGVPDRIESDNGPPFSSIKFADFASEMGFEHHRITPEHPRANGEAEVFMKLLNKTEQIAHASGSSRESVVQQMPMGYRSTPHPATGKCPYEALYGREVKTKLEYLPRTAEENIEKKTEIMQKDEAYKQKRAEKERRKGHTYKVGDHVLLKQTQKNKWSTAYAPALYKITDIHGSSIKARRMRDGRVIYRDALFFKPAKVTTEQTSTSWREKLLLNAQLATMRKAIIDRALETERAKRMPAERPQRNRRMPQRFSEYVINCIFRN